jgi:hypothetical protein
VSIIRILISLLLICYPLMSFGAEVGPFGNVDVRSINQKLIRVSTGQLETASYGIEYYSPNQHGGVFGTVYRVYGYRGDHVGPGGTYSFDYGDGITITNIVGHRLISLDDGGGLWRPVPNVDFGSTAWNIQVIFYATSLQIIFGPSADSAELRGWIDYTK